MNFLTKDALDINFSIFPRNNAFLSCFLAGRKKVCVYKGGELSRHFSSQTRGPLTWGHDACQLTNGQATHASLLHCQTDIYYQCNYNNSYIYACLLFNSALAICTAQDRCNLSLYKGTPSYIYSWPMPAGYTFVSQACSGFIACLHIF